MSSGTREELYDFHGVQMTRPFTATWESVQKFEARPDDILIVTYPKAGTTWVSCILDLLYFGQTDPERQTSIPIYKRVPFLEMAVSNPEKDINYIGVDLANELTTRPRLIKTHYPIVYVARNAKDNMVSYYHFDRMTAGQPAAGEWSEYFQRFLDAKMNFGSWYDHVNGWWQKKKTYSNLHYMFFEDLSENMEREIDRLCDFLGLSVSPDFKQQVMGQVQFEKMKNNKMTNYSQFEGTVMDFTVSPFIRKGKVGDWKNHFTVAQNEKFDEDFKQKMIDSTLQFRTLYKNTTTKSLNAAATFRN